MTVISVEAEVAWVLADEAVPAVVDTAVGVVMARALEVDVVATALPAAADILLAVAPVAGVEWADTIADPDLVVQVVTAMSRTANLDKRTSTAPICPVLSLLHLCSLNMETRLRWVQFQLVSPAVTATAKSLKAPPATPVTTAMEASIATTCTRLLVPRGVVLLAPAATAPVASLPANFKAARPSTADLHTGRLVREATTTKPIPISSTAVARLLADTLRMRDCTTISNTTTARVAQSAQNAPTSHQYRSVASTRSTTKTTRPCLTLAERYRSARI